jgi:cytochrome c biogenesis protein CcdA
MTKKLTIFITLALVVALLVGYGALRQDSVNTVTLGSPWFVPLLVVAALVDSVNPCAFSVLLLTLAFLVSLGRTRRNIVAIGSFYISGVFLIYILIGLGLVQALAAFAVPHLIARIGAAVLIAVGFLNIVNELFPSFPIKTKIPRAAHRTMAVLMEKASYQTAFVLGLFVGLSEFPCTGGPYLLILGLLANSGTFTQGFGYLVLYNLIFVLPLVIILGVGSDRAVLERVQQWKRERSGTLRFWGGVAMVVLGITIFLLP